MLLPVWFWLMMFLWLFFGVWREYTPQPTPFVRSTGVFMLFILFAILGWQVFGSPVK